MEVKAQGSLEEAQASIRAQMAQAQSRATASQKSLAGPEQRRLESLADRQSMPFGMLMRHFKALRAIPDTPERI
jgi:hypothetical protein